MAAPANNATELIAYAKANPGKLNYGSFGACMPPAEFTALVRNNYDHWGKVIRELGSRDD